ncbi:chemotaxis protein CheX [Desulfovibrio ferrophilus]|uniref:Chemotaxis protein CheC n=1 Tax=Desulfovibrio ferrophilus TaxID=241368 RepID=A0A2Z6B119_9BACT|nr:chemotaxis protein CheX [Desulfovibrio ferrophilus]BBD09209.1 chemotaxis protein CheC [Desulfovibrio ferrophilus]
MSIRYDVSFINPFLGAVINVLETMAMVQVTPGKPFVKTNRAATGDVTGLIGVTGFATGTMALTMSQGAILGIVTNMIGEEYTKINDEVADAVGELTNMISGQARRSLAENGMTFKASTPSVIVGKGHQVNHVGAGAILSIPFSTDGGDFIVEICFTKSEKIEEDAKAAPREKAAKAEPKPAPEPTPKPEQAPAAPQEDPEDDLLTDHFQNKQNS